MIATLLLVVYHTVPQYKLCKISLKASHYYIRMYYSCNIRSSNKYQYWIGHFIKLTNSLFDGLVLHTRDSHTETNAQIELAALAELEDHLQPSSHPFLLLVSIIHIDFIKIYSGTSLWRTTKIVQCRKGVFWSGVYHKIIMWVIIIWDSVQ